jgi:signal transduction histidine kinase
MLLIGLSFSANSVAHAYSQFWLHAGQSPPASGQWVAWSGTWLWAPGWVLVFTLILLLFPDGRLPSPRWRWAARLTVAALVCEAVGSMLDPNPTGFRAYRNPLGIRTANLITGGIIELVGTVGTIVAAVACVVALVMRFRRSRGEEREQMKWFAYGGVAMIVLLPAESVFAQGRPILSVLSFVAVPILPVAIAIAVLKYRLYDIDVVISKTIVYGALAAFITVVYVAIVVGLGTLVSSSGHPDLGLSILATAIVAVAFQPVRERVQRFANRLVYGDRATPYETLSNFASRMGGAVPAQDLLPTMAQTLAEGTGAVGTTVWLALGAELRAEAIFPPGEPMPHPVALDGTGLILPDATLALPVHHRGELLGALGLTKPRGERLTPTEEGLARNLASQAGLVLRNVRLTEELYARLDDLRASRLRIVAAADNERRRFERTISEGTERQLLGLVAGLREAQGLVESDPAGADALVSDIEARTDAALQGLRELARGIYPPLLSDQGIVAAVHSHGRRISPPPLVEVEAAGVSRHPSEVEGALYFCCVEALRNAAAHGAAPHVAVRLDETENELSFTVVDDGRGFDPALTPPGAGLQNMADRLEALGGTLTVSSSKGYGTTVTGRVPVRTPALADTGAAP